MHSTTSPHGARRLAIAASVLVMFGTATVACGEDVVDNDVETDINNIDNSIEDFVDTLFTDTTNP